MKNCFVIMPIGEEKSETRRRSDQVLNHIIKPVTTKNNYHTIRADEISEPGMISRQVLKKIIESDLVVADLSGHNPNVFYELAIRHALRKPFIQLLQEDEKIPFDISDTRTIRFNYTDLDSVARAKEVMELQIRSIIEKGDIKYDTPISVSLETEDLISSSQSDKQYLGKLMEAVADMRYTIGEIEGTLKKNSEYSYRSINKEYLFRVNELIHLLTDDRTGNKLDESLDENEEEMASVIESIRRLTRKELLKEER